MSAFVLDLQEIDKTKYALAGGKGANLGELLNMGGVPVPGGFCVTTEVYRKVIDDNPAVNTLLNELLLAGSADSDDIHKISDKIRSLIESAIIPENIAADICTVLDRSPATTSWAIRSSATAEDLPTNSFAGQQDTYLNITGKDAVLRHITRCWASLFTIRATMYRIQNGFDHRDVSLAVVVQEMVFPQASGVIFTADPVTGNRAVLSIDAGFGLGEALVSGAVNADNYKVQSGVVTNVRIATKQTITQAKKSGGTVHGQVETARQNVQVLDSAQILELARLGRKIEAHFGSPQDIEWCLTGDGFHIVQSRPVTTLYPIPAAPEEGNRVYVSVAHQQMMTAPMRPLGLSLFQLTATRPMYEAGGRLFVDVTGSLASRQGRDMLIKVMGQHDPLVRDALITIIEREGFLKPLPPEAREAPEIKPAGFAPADIPADGAAAVAYLVRRNNESIIQLQADIRSKSGPELFDFILEDLVQLKKLLVDPQSSALPLAAINASAWLNEKIKEWLGESNVADVLSQSVPGNITSEMGLALLDVADVIRPYPELVDYLQHTKNENFLRELPGFNGGKEARDAIAAYLHKYGMRCAGEIDITNSRWSEKPAILLPAIISNIKGFEQGAGMRRFEQGLKEALAKEQDILERLTQLPDGAQKAMETKGMIERLRSLAGYREYPKYMIIGRYYIYKQALMKEAQQLVEANVIGNKEDVYYLTFEEFRQVVATRQSDNATINARLAQHRFYRKLTPPRVITSEGEVIKETYKNNELPTGAMAGLAVSSGVVEGRARIIHSMENANLEEGDILITTFTDPGWTPLFAVIKGLVTEVGGLMTHGSVIAREYGLPAVVGVEDATRIIKDGQRIRVNGSAGYVEIIPGK